MQFSEHVDYLRYVGALDESDPHNLRVIIPNYINNPSNCVASSSYYSVCCVDECENILGHIERELCAPDATVAQIVALWVSLPATVNITSRTLSPALMSRLEDIAAHSGGHIHLHGRLLAQWLHYAFPQECAYPHVKGTTAPLKLEDWKDETGFEPIATEEEMQHHLKASSSQSRAEPHAEVHARHVEGNGMWRMEEELIVRGTSTTTARRADPPTATVFRKVVFATVLVCSVLSLVQSVKSSLEQRHVLPTHQKTHLL